MFMTHARSARCLFTALLLLVSVAFGADAVAQDCVADPMPFGVSMDEALSEGGEISARTADLNNDGDPDAIIFTDSTWTEQGNAVQIYMECGEGGAAARLIFDGYATSVELADSVSNGLRDLNYGWRDEDDDGVESGTGVLRFNGTSYAP